MKQRIWISITLVLCLSFVMAMFTACPHVEVIEQDTTPPASVTNISITTTIDSITLSWTNPSDPDFSYTEVSVKNNANGAVITQTVQGNAGASSATSFSGLNDNTEYSISFVTVDTSQNKSAATTMTAKTKLRDTTPPGEVESLTARAFHQKVLLTWVNPYDEDFTSVEVFSMPAAGNLSNPVVVRDLTRLETSSFMATGLENGTEYIFKVRAIDESGNYSAWKSATKAPVQSNLALTVTLPNDNGNIVLTNDRAPVRVSAVSNYQITKAVWKKGVKNVAVDPETLLNDAGATEFSLASDGIPSTFYVTESASYDIAVVNESGCYEYEQVDVKTIDKTPLAAVTNLEIECDGTNIIVSWTNPEPENAYDSPVKDVVISYIFNDNPIDADNRSVTVDAGPQSYSLAIPNGKTENDFVRVKIKNVDEVGNISEEITGDYTFCCDCIMTTMANVQTKIQTMTRSRKVIVVGEVQNNDLSAIKTGLEKLHESNNSIQIYLDLSKTTGLTEICDNSLCSIHALKSVNISSSVRRIGKYAFAYCHNLIEVNIPNSVESIGEHAFYYCDRLASIKIPNSVTSIDNDAFSYCSIYEVCYEGNVEDWLKISFENGNSNPCFHDTLLYFNGELVEDIIIPNGVRSITEYAFSNCTSLTGITIPNSVTSIGEAAFCGCTSLTSITIPNSVMTMGKTVFSGCSNLGNVTIGNGIRCIKTHVFSDCRSLVSVTIPISVTSIGDRTFSTFTSLTSVTIPGSVTSIGREAFFYCTSLTSVVFEDTTSVWYKTGNYDYTGGESVGTMADAEANATLLNKNSWCYFYSERYTAGE